MASFAARSCASCFLRSSSIPEILAEQQETKALQMDADKKINLWIDELRKKQEAQLRDQ
ncbi:hypothetical protein ACUOCP_32390 [Escherichia sp. R-CC3]